ncbi:MAG: TenA family protein [Gemmatimonadota bacterium]|nr:TenA family protein [Gemmatimonadota bacterium]
MLHQKLWDQNAKWAADCLNHPFVRGLGDGTLDTEAFRSYVAQDAFFLQAFVRAYALALAKIQNMEHAEVFHGLIGGVLDELKLHAGYAKELDIKLDTVRPFPVTLAYINFLMARAWHCELAEILAAMVPCMKLYHHIGTSLLPQLHPTHPYKDWIHSYSSSAFEVLCRKLEELLDRIATDTPAVRDAYRYAMQCEVEFFTAPLQQS